jgi:hypothetical protein
VDGLVDGKDCLSFGRRVDVEKLCRRHGCREPRTLRVGRRADIDVVDVDFSFDLQQSSGSKSAAQLSRARKA